ncbi:uncharacterized protein GIQ15_04841 [Arthroderma uncinatum]|uniref:uncharacterized protein n=1 Tax=Arthroderma uncinatum TaxID=74035 RepID=UPI00144A86A9|nr:uncharacterized protein GIQ15_04841 [Arthroderma uncinatum]KAF3482082.1 hypothetical protein GIQ15_04841 [Arthroderma uncinatum]
MADTNTTTTATRLISLTIANLNGAAEVYDLVNDDEGLRPAFHEAGRGLTLIKGALQAAKTQLNGGELAQGCRSAMSSLEACNAKSKLAKSVFEEVAQAPRASSFERYKIAVQKEGKGNRVEVLVMGMMTDVCEMAKDGTIEAAMESHVKVLREALEKLSKMEPSIPDEQAGYNITNHGKQQYVVIGGTQNNTRGSGNQFPGASFTGAVHFGVTEGNVKSAIAP